MSVTGNTTFVASAPNGAVLGTAKPVAAGETTVVLIEVAGQLLGLPAARVEQVRPAAQVTRLPGAPQLVEGVVNLHGDLTPVLDGRRRLGIARREMKLSDRFVILRARGRRLVMHVDAAVGVVNVPQAEIDAAASLRIDTFGCAGIARLRNGMFVVHDTDALLSPREFGLLEGACAALRPRSGHATA